MTGIGWPSDRKQIPFLTPSFYFLYFTFLYYKPNPRECDPSHSRIPSGPRPYCVLFSWCSWCPAGTVNPLCILPRLYGGVSDSKWGPTVFVHSSSVLCLPVYLFKQDPHGRLLIFCVSPGDGIKCQLFALFSMCCIHRPWEVSVPPGPWEPLPGLDLMDQFSFSVLLSEWKTILLDAKPGPHSDCY